MNEHTYNHPWNRVASSFWQKHPSRHNPHVQSVDTFRRSFDADQRTFSSCRLITVASNLPSFMVALGIPSSAKAVEITEVNAAEKRLVLRSRNITASQFIVVEETCCYRPHPDDPDHKTLYTAEARISSVAPLVASRLEQWSLGNMMRNANRGLQTMEELCSAVRQHGFRLPSIQTLYSSTLDVETASS